MMKRTIVFFMAVSLSLISCDKNSEIDIYQLRIDLCPGGSYQSTTSTEGIILDSELLYKGFNLSNYGGCTEVIFVACVKSFIQNNNCHLELYNLTDSTVIADSKISTNSTKFIWIESQNLINNFPQKDIDLTLRLSTQHEGTVVHVNSASLYLNFPKE